jgi:hypothetical protein
MRAGLQIEEGRMIELAHPEDVQQLVRLLVRGDPEGFSRTSGVGTSSLYRYMAGKTAPQRRAREKIIAGSGLSRRFIEALLLPAIRAARLARTPLTETFLEDLEQAEQELGDQLSAAALVEMAVFLAQLEDPVEPWERADPSSEEERRRAVDLLARLESCEPGDRRFLIETCPEYQTLALVEVLRDRSERIQSEDTAAAGEWAELAQLVAQMSEAQREPQIGA